MAKKTEAKKTGQRKEQPRQKQHQQSERGSLNKIGALWLKKGKNGFFMSGTIEVDGENSIRVLVFKNGYKEEAKHPDYVIYEPSDNASRSEDEDLPFSF